LSLILRNIANKVVLARCETAIKENKTNKKSVEILIYVKRNAVFLEPESVQEPVTRQSRRN